MAVSARRSAKDSVFRDFFSRPENLLALYKTLHPEDTQVTEDMLRDVTIENVLTDQMYNDLGFTVGNRLMILVEAQSTWSVNIIIRAFLYVAESYQERFEQQCVNLYSSRKVALPEPELYVIYTGDRQDRPKELTLSEAFFGGRKTAIEVTVKMLYGEDKADIIGQYVRFCRVFNMQTRAYGLTERAIRETIDICKDENVLKAYLEEREKEVTGIMMALFNEETIQKAYGTEKFDEGRMKGRAEGKAEGRAEGKAEGRAEGKAEGRAEGRVEGRAEGKDEQARATVLNLHRAGMADSMIAAMVGYAESVVSSWIAQYQAKTV